MNNNICSACNQKKTSLSEKIQKVSFAIDETVLYLDVYPNSKEALAYYHQLIDQLETLVDEYESKNGPLTSYGNKSQNSWDWIRGPWPWEYRANI